MRKDLKLKSADCGWPSAVSTGPTGGTVASGHAHHGAAFLRRARDSGFLVNSETRPGGKNHQISE